MATDCSQRDSTPTTSHASLARRLAPAFCQAPLHMEAQAARAQGDYDTAARLFAESLDLNEQIGDEGMVDVELHNLGNVEIRRGRADAAAELLARLASRSSGGDPYGDALLRLNEAALAQLRGHTVRARQLLAEARSRLEAGQVELAPDDRADLDWLEERLAAGG